MKSHYELLGLDRSADAETIKSVFRKEIARYHPDKVQHLGQEFQEMAAQRASQLTAAYKTLSDPELRRRYNEELDGGIPALEPSVPAGDPRPTPVPSQPGDLRWSEVSEPPLGPDAPADFRQFERDRAGRDAIVRRAVLGKVQGIVEGMYGDVDTPAVKGFDLALVPRARARLLSTAPPRVLVRVSDAVERVGIGEAWTAASRAGVHTGRSPVIIVLFGHAVAPHGELALALEQAQRQPRPAGAPDEIALIAVSINDWQARMGPGASAAVRKLAEKLNA